MSKTMMKKVKRLLLVFVLGIFAVIGGVFSVHQQAEAKAEGVVSITQVQFRTSGEDNWVFLRMSGQTDYTTPNQLQDPSFVTNTNILDKVTVYFNDEAISLKKLWDGSAVMTYLWGDADTFCLRMKAGYLSTKGVGMRIEEGAEIPMNDGSVLRTQTTRTFWQNWSSADCVVDKYADGYEQIPVSIEKLHIRANDESLNGLQFLIGLSKGNDWEGKGSAYPTEVKGEDGTNSYVLEGYWRKMYASNFLSKIKFHVQATDTWVTLGEALSSNASAPQITYVFNHWGEQGGTMNTALQTAYSAATVDKIMIEAGCELPSYYFIGNRNAPYTVHVLDATYICTNNDMSLSYWGTSWTFEKKYQVTFNGENALLLNPNDVLEYPTDLSENKEPTAGYTYVYNWYNGSELYDFSQPVTGHLNLTSNGTFTEIPNEYKVTYYALDGKTILYEDVFAYGETLTLRGIDSVEGYTDCSWAYNNGEVPTTMPAMDISLTIKGTPKTYTLSFANGSETIDSMTVTYATAIGELPVISDKTGYHGGVWTVDGEVITAETAWLIAGDKTAEASYTPNTYTLTFVTEAGEAVDSITVTFDTEIGELPVVPEKEHYIGKWAIDGAEFDATSIWTVAADKTATAVYEPASYVVTFDGANATRVAYGGKVEKPADPTKESTVGCEYTFAGWYNGDVKWNFETDTISGDMDLVAKYTESKKLYTVTFNVTGYDGFAVAPIQVAYGDVLDLTKVLNEKEISGYTYSMCVNGVEKANIKVLGDVTVDVVFTVSEQSSDNASFNCMSVVGNMSAFVTVAAFALGMALKKRKEND